LNVHQSVAEYFFICFPFNIVKQ